MTGCAAALVVAAARACVGTRFRPGGRVPGIGLDCVGVVLVAAGALGEVRPVVAYRLGGDHAALAGRLLRAAGARLVSEAAAGDVLEMAPAPGLTHLGVWVGDGLVQAHAGLGRVTEGPMDQGWDLRGIWRLAGVD